MRKLGNNEARRSRRWRVVSIAAALLGAAVLFQPDLADAAPHGGGGGFHGGGGFGGFHGGGFAGFTAAGSTVVLWVCIMASAPVTEPTGTRVGATDNTAGGGMTG